jgi:DNA modification methylase
MNVEEIPLTDVVPDPANVRLHEARNLEAIKGSLARFGQQKPIVVDRAGVIRAGNGTFEAARQLGWKTIHVVRTDLEGLEGTAYAIADNRTSDLSGFDEPALAQLLRDLQAEDALLGVGFDEQEFSELLAGLESEVDLASIQDGETPEPPEVATTQRGDVWILGRHRLLCGDSSSSEDLDRLLDGAPVHLVNTDPPYNVKVEPRSNNAIAAGLSSFGPSKPTHHQKLDLARHPKKSKPTGKMRPKDRPLANDFVSDEEFGRMLRAWFGNAARVLLPGRGFYIWGGYSNFGNYPPALRESGLYFSQAIIWDKLHPVLTRKDFLGSFEVAYYGWKEGAAHRFYGPPNATDLWAVKKVSSQKSVHLTEKPVELAARAIAYSSRKGEHVLDLL